ncbi:MAG: hypothetical protein WCI19_09220 [Betaproteobacteria bacterium]|jgi:hypothetical protein|nr:hypothetical protein [Rhodocyclales bacterium]
MSKLYWALWPSFLVAGVVEFLFFLIVNPQELYLFGEPTQFSPIATYTIGFFCFWGICAASSMATCFFQSSTPASLIVARMNRTKDNTARLDRRADPGDFSAAGRCGVPPG